MTPSDKAPLVGWMILEDYCEDMSQWDGVITYPDPTGANLAWQNPTKMIEYSAYEKLKAENRRLNLICEHEFGRADSVGELVKQNADLLQWADRLEEALIAKCENMDYPNQVKQILIEFHQWRERRGEG